MGTKEDNQEPAGAQAVTVIPINGVIDAVVAEARAISIASAMMQIVTAFGELQAAQEDKEGDADIASPLLSDLRWIYSELERVWNSTLHLNAPLDKPAALSRAEGG